jgi:hypothetical protein
VPKPHHGTVALGATASERRDCRHENPPPSPQASPSICLLRHPFPTRRDRAGGPLIPPLGLSYREVEELLAERGVYVGLGAHRSRAMRAFLAIQRTGWWWSGCRPMRPTSTRLRRCGPTSGPGAGQSDLRHRRRGHPSDSARDRARPSIVVAAVFVPAVHRPLGVMTPPRQDPNPPGREQGRWRRAKQ